MRMERHWKEDSRHWNISYSEIFIRRLMSLFSANNHKLARAQRVVRVQELERAQQLELHDGLLLIFQQQRWNLWKWRMISNFRLKCRFQFASISCVGFLSEMFWMAYRWFCRRCKLLYGLYHQVRSTSNFRGQHR